VKCWHVTGQYSLESRCAGVRSLVNKFVIRLLEARRYILDQDSASVQRLWAGFGVNSLYFCGKMAGKTNLAFCTQQSFLSDERRV